MGQRLIFSLFMALIFVIAFSYSATDKAERAEKWDLDTLNTIIKNLREDEDDERTLDKILNFICCFGNYITKHTIPGSDGKQVPGGYDFYFEMSKKAKNLVIGEIIKYKTYTEKVNTFINEHYPCYSEEVKKLSLSAVDELRFLEKY